MKLDQETIDRINSSLREAECVQFGEVRVRFVRHQGEWVKVTIERDDQTREVVFRKKQRAGSEDSC